MAGGLLNSKNPITAPNKDMITSKSGSEPLLHKITPKVIKTVITIPPARPSRPSMRLIAFMMVTTQRIVIGQAINPGSNSWKKGPLICSRANPV